MVWSPFSLRLKNVVHLSRCVRKQMSNRICGFVSEAPPNSCCLYISTGYSKPKYTDIGFQASQGSCFGSCIYKQSSNWHSLRVKNVVNFRQPQPICLDFSFGCQHVNVKLLVPKQGIIPKVKCNVGPLSWPRGCASTGLIFGLLVCCSTSEPVHAEAAQPEENKEDTSVSFSHGKKVYTDYSITGIPGDGRCLFRSVAHGACLRSGKPAPNENRQRELADDLRARGKQPTLVGATLYSLSTHFFLHGRTFNSLALVKVADEFIKRQKESEWFVEGDFDTYVSQIRKPHVWGGEPELFMASHVLQMPIIVYMYDEDSGGLISIAEYGQEYGKENPIKVLYHGFGHYDALQIPGKKGAQSRL